MEPTALAYAIQALTLIPSLIKTGADILTFVQETETALKKMQAESRDPTAAEWDALNAKIAELRKALHSD